MLHPKRTLIFGGGYVGRRVAGLAAADGDQVWVTTRSRAKAADFFHRGWQPVIADWGSEAGLNALDQVRPDEVDRVLIAVSYDRDSTISRYESQVRGLQRLLQRLSPHTSVAYISTTGVYHQTNGEWVDENSPARPRREGGRTHLMAEQCIRRRGMGSSWTILRLAGIYGPGRVPLARAVKAGTPIESPAEGYLNLIHVDDAAAVTMAAWRRLEELRSRSSSNPAVLSTANRVFVVADDEPVVRRDFYGEVARVSRAPDPVFTKAANTMNQSMRSASNKRVWNRRMKRQLCRNLLFPTFREGLADILR